MLTSTKDFVERQSRMLDTLSNKLQSSIGHRADMYVEDSEAIDNDSCRVMIAYAKNIGPVSADELEDFVIRQFNGLLVPNMATAQSFSDHGRVMLVLTRASVTRPIDDAKQMHTVSAGAIYVDTTLADTWEVMKTEDGGQYLRRVSADDINQIVSERRRRMATANEAPLTITAAMNLYCGVSEVGPGDTVKVVYRDSVHANCVVSSTSDNNVSVKIPNVGTVTVPRQAIVQVQEVSAKRAASSKAKLLEYYKQIYGPDYAKMLTNESVSD